MTKPVIAYLTGEYPKVSHTFIQREIKGLRNQGWTVHACSVRRTSAKDIVGREQEQEARDTFALVEAGKNPLTVIRSHFWAMRQNPKRWISAAKLAFKVRQPGIKSSFWHLFYFLEAGILAKHLYEKNVVHLHNHFANSSCTVAMLASEMSGIPFSVTMHGPAIFYEPRYWRIDEKIARASFVSCISHFCRSQAMYFSSTECWEKLKIVHCGVLPQNYGAARKSEPGKHIVFVGRLAAIKGVPLLLEAFARVKEQHSDALLTIVGDGGERANCVQIALDLKLEKAVNFAGYKSSNEVADILNHADLLVLPSFAEGVPVTLMEAMASGVPVIASRVAGVGELVEDGVTGFTVPPGDLDTIAERISQLLGDVDLRSAMGARGQATVKAEFDLTKETEWLGRILEGSINGKLPEGLRPLASSQL